MLTLTLRQVVSSPYEYERIWYELLNTMGTYTPEMFANLGRLYVEDQRFTQNIDSYGAGLARFMCDAMGAFRESGKSNSKK